MTQSHGGDFCMAFIIHVNTMRSLPDCLQPAQTFCSEHIVHWLNQRKICSRYPTQSQFHSYAHKSACQSELSGELALAKVYALPVILITILCMLCDIYTQVRSPPKRQHSYETEIQKPPRSQWRVSPLIYHSFSLLISFFCLCLCTFQLEDPHLQMCVPFLSVFLFPF